MGVKFKGSLVNAMEKSGTPILLGSSRAARVWVKPAVMHGDIESCSLVTFPGIPATAEAKPGASKSSEVKRTLSPDWRNRKAIAPQLSAMETIEPKAIPQLKGATAYAFNAAWALLLDHQVPTFKKHVDRLLEATR